MKKLTPFKAVVLGALLGILLVAGIAAGGLTTWVGKFYGDGSGLSNVMSIMNPVLFDPITFIDVANSQTNTWNYNPSDFRWQFNGGLEANGSMATYGGAFWFLPNGGNISYGGSGFSFVDTNNLARTIKFRAGGINAYGYTNPLWTVNTVLISDGNDAAKSLANGTGYLHDDGSGNFVYQIIPWTDIAQGGATNGQFMSWNGSAWVPTTDSGSNTTINTYQITYKVAKGGTVIITNDLQLLTTNVQANTVLSVDANSNVTSIVNGTGYLHDNGSGTFVYQSINLASSDVTGTLADSHLSHSFTNDVDQTKWITNLVDGVTIDPNTSGQLFITNASFNILGYKNKVTTFNYEFTITYSNSSASAITIGGSPSTKYIGSGSTNSLSLAAGKEAMYWIQVRPNRTNIVNASEQ